MTHSTDSTARERQVLALMAQGLTNAGLCSELHLSAKTVEGHVRNIFTKLDLDADERSHRRVLGCCGSCVPKLGP